MSLLGLCADDRAGRSADDCAGSRAARSARQQAAEYATDDSASDCTADRPLARRRGRRTRRRRCIFGAGRRDLFDRGICIFDIRNTPQLQRQCGACPPCSALALHFVVPTPVMEKCRSFYLDSKQNDFAELN